MASYISNLFKGGQSTSLNGSVPLQSIPKFMVLAHGAVMETFQLHMQNILAWISIENGPFQGPIETSTMDRNSIPRFCRFESSYHTIFYDNISWVHVIRGLSPTAAAGATSVSALAAEADRAGEALRLVPVLLSPRRANGALTDAAVASSPSFSCRSQSIHALHRAGIDSKLAVTAN